jgi:microcystin-dependent protein
MAWPNNEDALPEDIESQDLLGATGKQHHSMHVAVHTLLNTIQKVLGTGWGDYTNPEFRSVQQRVVDVEAVVPVGAIIAYGGSTAPDGWALCDGSLHGSTALTSVLGSPNSPDLRDKFIVGSGTTFPDKTAGGSTSVTVGLANMPSHKHDVGVTATQNPHNHGGSTGIQGGHWHNVAVNVNVSTPWKQFVQTSDTGAGIEGAVPNSPWGSTNIAGSGSGTGNTDSHAGHYHDIASNYPEIHPVVTESNKGSGTPLTVKPPYYALVYLIRK